MSLVPLHTNNLGVFPHVIGIGPGVLSRVYVASKEFSGNEII